MLTLGAIDLEMLQLALEYQADWDSRYWFDPRTGETNLWLRDSLGEGDESEEDLEAAGAILVEPIRPYEAYRDMESFIAELQDERAKDLLWRAIEWLAESGVVEQDEAEKALRLLP